MKKHAYCLSLNNFSLALLLTIGAGGTSDLMAQTQSPAQPALGSDAKIDKDRIIADLVRRVELLERRLATNSGPASLPTHAGAPSQASIGTPPPALNTPSLAQRSFGASPAASPTAVANTGTAPSANEPADEETTRALERTLIREGGLVLPPKTFEIDPRLTYEHRSANALQVVNIGGQAQISRQDLKRHATEMAIGLRAGMKWATQLEISVPYSVNRERRVIAGGTDQTDRASGFGNVEIGVTKQVVSEAGAMPGLLGTLRWSRAASAEDFGNPAAAGNSFSTVAGGLTFVKRRDPMVFVASLTHAVTHSRRINGLDINPGNATGLRLGSFFAVSPDTSMRFGFDFTHSDELSVNGTDIAGSSTVRGLFNTGFSFVLSPEMLLGIEGGVGLTSDSPDFRLGVSLPIRF